MRDNTWLERLLRSIWADHFHDVPAAAPIKIQFGKRARTRLGSLSFDSRRMLAIIRLTGLFRDSDVPEMVLKATIVHELCHYAHGFNSGLDRKHKYPHAGGIIRQEFAERGLEDLYLAQKRWLKANWLKIVKKHYPSLSARRPVRRRYIRVRFI